MFLTNEERKETIRACRFCPMCYVADRAARLSARESHTPRGRATILFAQEQGLLPSSDAASSIMYSTSNDGLIREWCVGHYDHEELVVDARARLFSEGRAPEEVKQYVRELHSKSSPGSPPGDILKRAGLTPSKTGDVLIFGGCSVRESQSGCLTAMAGLLDRAGVGWRVLDKEPCCGWPLYQLGDFEGAKQFSANIARAIKSTACPIVVVLDADCYRMLATRVSRFGGDLDGVRIVHAVSMLDDLLRQGRLSVIQRVGQTAVYHDPCALARYAPETEAPRRILHAVLAEPLREMAAHGSMTQCCGAGGMLQIHRPDLTNGFVQLLRSEAKETGADLLVTGCPRCRATMEGEPSTQTGPSVMNLVELLWQAVKPA